MKKKLFSVLLVAAMTLSLVACGGGSSSSGSSSESAGGDAAATAEGGDAAGGGYDEVTIKIGHSDTTENLIHKSLENFAAYVNEQSGGKVTVDIYASEQLGSNSEMAEMIEMGSLDAMMLPQGAEANYAPKMVALGLPFLFESYEQVYACLDNEEIAAELTEGLDSHNMIQLAFWENGLRQVTSNNEITKPADLAGLKIRTPEDNMTIAIFTALGAAPSPLAFSELYLALQQGTFDAQENPVANIYANNFQDVQKYMAMTNHKYECKNMIMSLSTWNKLNADTQALLLEAAKIYGQEHRDAIVSNQDAQQAELEAAGMTVTQVDAQAFVDATASVYDDFYAQNDWAEAFVGKINDIKATVK